MAGHTRTIGVLTPFCDDGDDNDDDDDDDDLSKYDVQAFSLFF